MIFQHTTIHIQQIEEKFSKLTNQMRYVRQENDFNEIDLQELKQKLTQLTEDIEKSLNMRLQDDYANNKLKQKILFTNRQKSTFDMNQFKHVYSIEDTKTRAIPYFWKNFDKKHYSIWFCEYKYPKDLTQIFMSCNLVSGFFQRLDKLRQYTFASMFVFGENNNNTITGIWIWPGHELVFQFSRDWQLHYESFSWKRLSLDDTDTRTLVNQYLLWQGEYNGNKFNQREIFK